MPFEAGQPVTLGSFQGTLQAPEGTQPGHDYWRLIGRSGVIASADDSALGRLPDGPRVLVQFNEDPAALGLHCHNPMPRALWIRVADLARQ